MQTVKLYKVNRIQSYSIWETGESYSLYPWPGDDCDSMGYDDGGHDYILPDEYEVRKQESGIMYIGYKGENGNEEIIDYNGHPALSGHEVCWILKRA